MIRRVFKGRSAYGLVRYLYGEGRRNEHTDAHMIGSWDGNPAGLEPALIDGDGRHDVGPLVRALEQPVKACERAPEQYVYHLVLRNDEADRRLSDEEWTQVCTAAMDRTGIAPDGDPAGCRWVAVRHAEDHVHLVATLAREDGRPPRIWGDYARLAEVAHEFEDKYGLRSTAGRDDNTAAARPGVKEQVTAENRGRRTSPRVTLRQKVKAAAASSAGFGDFSDRLAAHGVTVWPRMSERNPEQITGYSVSLNDWTNAAGEPVRFGGGKLAPDLSWPKLRARWEPQPRPNTASGAGEGTGRHAASESPPRGPLTGDEAEQVWREAERIVREAAERISAAAGTDPDSAADAAWAASDTLSGAAVGLEGEAGGPITNAAAAFDRAGRDCYRRLPTRSDTGTALRSAGRMMALLAAGTQTPGRAGRGRHGGPGGPGSRRRRPSPVPATSPPGRGRARVGRAATSRGTAAADGRSRGHRSAPATERRRPRGHVVQLEAVPGAPNQGGTAREQEGRRADGRGATAPTRVGPAARANPELDRAIEPAWTRRSNGADLVSSGVAGCPTFTGLNRGLGIRAPAAS